MTGFTVSSETILKAFISSFSALSIPVSIFFFQENFFGAKLSYVLQFCFNYMMFRNNH